MPARLIVLDIIAVLAGAVVGLFVVDILAWLLFNTSVSGMVASIGRWIIVLLTVGLFAVYYRMLPPTGAAIGPVAIVPTAIAKTARALPNRSIMRSATFVAAHEGRSPSEAHDATAHAFPGRPVRDPSGSPSPFTT